jgi:hypothetical protein
MIAAAANGADQCMEGGEIKVTAGLQFPMDAADEGRLVETFLLESWLEHLRQHERVTNVDRLAQEAVNISSCPVLPR